MTKSKILSWKMTRISYTSGATLYVFDDTFLDRIILRFGNVNWPSVACDFSAFGFLLYKAIIAFFAS